MVFDASRFRRLLAEYRQERGLVHGLVLQQILGHGLQSLPLLFQNGLAAVVRLGHHVLDFLVDLGRHGLGIAAALGHGAADEHIVALVEGHGADLLAHAVHRHHLVGDLAGPLNVVGRAGGHVPQHERELTAYHEAGHAVVMHALPDHDPVNQITIVPRGQAGGMTISLPEEDRSYLSKKYMEDEIVALLGGRVAEKLCLGDISTGASNDIQRATAIARKMVASYGMSDKLGTVSFESGHDEVFLGRTMGQGRGYSEAVAAQIDEEVRRLVDEAYRRCEGLLTERRAQLENVAKYLLEHETMERDDFLSVVEGESAAPETPEM